MACNMKYFYRFPEKGYLNLQIYSLLQRRFTRAILLKSLTNVLKNVLVRARQITKYFAKVFFGTFAIYCLLPTLFVLKHLYFFSNHVLHPLYTFHYIFFQQMKAHCNHCHTK